MIEFGQKVQKVGIDKFDCAEGITVKGILLNYANPYARNIAYDEVNRCSVECTKEMAIKYNLNPSPCYYFVLATFATDANNNILGDKEQRVTFIQMSNNQYEHFLAASNNLASWHGYVTLQKKKRKGNNGKDYSFVESTPADDNADGFKSVSQALKDRINRLVSDKNFINTAIQLIDAATGLYEDKYLERIEQNKRRQLQQGGYQQGGYQQQPQAVQPPQQPQAAQLPPTAQNNGDVVKTTQTVPPQLPPQPTTVSQQPDDFGEEAGGDLPF
jgi:hypothetical protein